MYKSKIFNILNFSFFILAIIFAFLIVMFLTKYDILIKHDLVFSYGRKFLEPEHGRYIATFFNNFFTEILPEYFNIHPNDFKPLVVSPIKAILVILICLFVSFSAFLFTKKENIMQKTILNTSFTFVFILTFLFLFNIYFFCDVAIGGYLAVQETTVFFEYTCSLLVFIPFLSYLAYFYINQTNPSKLNFIVLYILSFFTGLSVDPIIVSTFSIISFWALIALIENRKKIKENFKYVLVWSGIYCTYILASFFYFIRPSHNAYYGDSNNILEYTLTYFGKYLNAYYNFLIDYSTLIIPIIILFVLSAVFLRKQHKCKRGFFFICMNLIILAFFYLMLFFLGFIQDATDSSRFFGLYYTKWISLYEITVYFFLLLSSGLFIDSITSKNKISNIIKITVCVLIILILKVELITNNIKNIKNSQNEMKELRQAAYIIEQATINETKEKIILPEEYKKYNDSLFLDYGPCSFFQYVNNVHPNIKKYYYELSEDENINTEFKEKENIADIKFQNLLTEKMYRHKKIINYCF